MKFINVGNFKNAQEELKNDKNNAVTSIFEYDNNLNNGLLN